MIKKKLTEKLDQYGGFHDSKLKQIYVEPHRCILGIVIDHAYDSVPSSTGEVVVPGEKGGVPKRYAILYRPMTILFKDIVQVVVKTEPDPVNEEVILSCQLVEDREETPLGTDFVHIEVTLTSLSRLDIFCRDLECRLS
jgi:hypothetical protein